MSDCMGCIYSRIRPPEQYKRDDGTTINARVEFAECTIEDKISFTHTNGDMVCSEYRKGKNGEEKAGYYQEIRI